MAYTPINSQVYCAAFAGAMAGMTTFGKIPHSTTTTDYDANAAVAGAFAESFDIAWNSATAISLPDMQLIQSESEGVWANRAPLGSVANDTSTTWDSITIPLVASVQSADSYITAQGVIPPIYIHEGTNTLTNVNLEIDVVDGLGSGSQLLQTTSQASLAAFDAIDLSNFAVTPTAITSTGPSVILDSNLVVFAGSSISQVTRGAGGAATALPAQPLGYLKLQVNGTPAVVPYYHAS